MVTDMFNNYNDVVTISELAEMLKIGRNTAYELVRAEIIPGIRIGRQLRISKQAVIEYLSKHNDPATDYRQSHLK